MFTHKVHFTCYLNLQKACKDDFQHHFAEEQTEVTFYSENKMESSSLFGFGQI